MKAMVDYAILLLYAVCMSMLWKLSKLGGVRYWFKKMLPFVILLLVFLLVKLGLRRKGYRAGLHKVRLAIFLAITLVFGSMIAYTATPYHGALSWKLEDWLNHKKVAFTGNNIYEYGINGILADIDEKVALPEELYIVDGFSVEFRKDGTITGVETMLYGDRGKGRLGSFLISYDANKGNKLDVWINKDVDMDVNPDKALWPLSAILEKSAYEDKVAYWSTRNEDQSYGILFQGRQEFHTGVGLQFVAGDADGDGIVGSAEAISKLAGGGAVVGYEAALYLPDDDTVTPVRYMMEPEYISQETLDAAHEARLLEEVKQSDGWTVDESNGTVYTFVPGNSDIGYRLVVVDAAAGSRLYALEKSMDSGVSWETVHENPFMGDAGVAEGIEFFSEDFGFIGIQGASGQHSQIYLTKDGGSHFTRIQLPMDQVTDLPQLGKAYGLTLEDYQYLSMPVYDGARLVVTVTPGVEESDGMAFYSEDGGESWDLLK